MLKGLSELAPEEVPSSAFALSTPEADRVKKKSSVMGPGAVNVMVSSELEPKPMDVPGALPPKLMVLAPAATADAPSKPAAMADVRIKFIIMLLHLTSGDGYRPLKKVPEPSSRRFVVNIS
jgi:hypothetical protein